MTIELQQLKQQLEAAAGKLPADLILENIQIVDVLTREIRPGSLAIFDERIVALDPALDVPALERFDGGGMYAIPGFLDAHIHIETTLLTPEALAEVIAPWGTTTLFVDAMEIANVAGIKGLKALIKDAHLLPFRIYLEIPSRVPTAPGLETAGAVIGVDEVVELLQLEESASLGELDPSKVLDYKPEYLEKILATLKARRICNGHAIGLTAAELNVYAAAHLSDDHECVTIQELLERLRVGISPFIREGSSERNVDELIRGVVEHDLPTERMMFCTDDKHVNDIAREGHISYNVQRSIDLGLDPISAIQMATINAACHFHLEHLVGSLTPGRFADILLLKNLKEIRPEVVFKSGKLVARDGRADAVALKKYPPEMMDTVRIPDNFSPERFQILSKGSRALCRVINLIPDQIINTETQEWMAVEGGQITLDIARDILKLSVVERYGKNGQVSNALVCGFKLKSGAMASSVSHDHHNIVAVGTNDADLALAVQTLGEMKGGFVICDQGKVLGSLALPFGGLMSLLPASEVMKRMDELNETARGLGCGMAAPFMTLSFISLPTVPELGLTDYGLIDVRGHRLTNLIVETAI